MDEFSFIDLIKQKTYRQPSIIRGIGDDAAVFRQSSQDIVTAVDTFVEDVHFSRSTMSPFHIGYRSLAANISDLSAMGAKPAFYLVSIVIPSSWKEDDLDGLYKGMADLGAAYQMDLIGGDTVSGNELALSITVIGFVNSDKVRYRHTAKPGDVVFVTGTLGDSAAGFHILTNPGEYLDQAYYSRRHRMPTIRVDFASELENLSRVTLNDISDGIANEANEIAEDSHVNLTVYEEKLPVSQNYNQFPESQQSKWQLYGGEDFELLGTVPSQDWDELKDIADRTQTPVTEVGYVSKNTDNGHYVWLVDRQQTNKLLEKKGYTHLK
ncbi:thiamine-phosphate kinase [Lentibacillus salinarum]|uniref:Thiamine-monophosphate kinase n=1 Tax=Lentibacillus salinarum TaxID=446820 RepID=A0ABW3ZYD8_9BACI